MVMVRPMTRMEVRQMPAKARKYDQPLVDDILIWDILFDSWADGAPGAGLLVFRVQKLIEECLLELLDICEGTKASEIKKRREKVKASSETGVWRNVKEAVLSVPRPA